jgi:hypothetical protein
MNTSPVLNISSMLNLWHMVSLQVHSGTTSKFLVVHCHIFPNEYTVRGQRNSLGERKCEATEHQGLEAVLTGISMSAEKRGVVCDMRTCRNAKGGWCAILEEMRERSDDEGLERVL